MQTDVEVLTGMLSIIERRYTRTFPAETRHGVLCRPRDGRAYAWSAAGALMMMLPVAFEDEAQRARIAALKAFGGDIVAFERSETMGQKQAIAAVKAAIKEVSQNGKTAVSAASAGKAGSAAKPARTARPRAKTQEVAAYP